MMRYCTPLRYPGGKQRLAPFIRELLEVNDLTGCAYAEPYAGGAGVACELLMQRVVSDVYLNDSSRPVFAFWRSVIAHTEELCRLISVAALTVEEWRRRRDIVRNPNDHSIIELGFSTLFLNRCNRSGVLGGGLIGGLNQTGEWKMDARFTRNELIRRVEALADRRSSIHAENLDAEKFIAEVVPKMPDHALVYCDPPYFEKSGRLYLNAYDPQDHRRIAGVIQEQLKRNWIVSYDNAPQILDYYSNRRSFIYDLQYTASRVYVGREVFIFADSLRIPNHSRIPALNVAIAAGNAANVSTWRSPKSSSITSSSQASGS